MKNNPPGELSRGAAEAAILDILQQFKIDIDHPAACLREARQRVAAPGFDDPTLAQWQNEPFVTIDNPDSRDLDQALLIEETQVHGYRVRYALADAAYYVPPGSALFTEALKRGVTYYTPLLAAPMLPTALSEGLVSLNPEKLRRALVFDMFLSDDGSVLTTSVVRALVRSQAKLSYGSVQAFLDATNAKQAHEYQHKKWARSLRLLRSLGETLMQRAHDRDVIPFNRREAQVELSDHGIVLSQRTRYRSEKYNEQISLLCNMQGAEMLKGLSQDNDDLQAIFRAHDAPLEGRLSALKRLLQNFADTAGLSEQWRWKNGQTLANFVAALPAAPEHRGKVLAIERQILISNQASEYRSEPGRHHALAASSYARFSSPMREIVGIFTHKELLEALGAKASDFTPPAVDAVDEQTRLQHDNELRERIINIANESRQTQKQISKRVEFLALQAVLSRDLLAEPSPLRDGVIMGFRGDRIYVAVASIATDLKITSADLAQQYGVTYQLNELQALSSHGQAPAWTLGDHVKISAVGFDAGKNRFQLALHSA